MDNEQILIRMKSLPMRVNGESFLLADDSSNVIFGVLGNFLWIFLSASNTPILLSNWINFSSKWLTFTLSFVIAGAFVAIFFKYFWCFILNENWSNCKSKSDRIETTHLMRTLTCNGVNDAACAYVKWNDKTWCSSCELYD